MGYASEIVQQGFISEADVVLAEHYINNACDRDKMKYTVCSIALANRFIKEHGEKPVTDTCKIDHMWNHKVNKELNKYLRYNWKKRDETYGKQRYNYILWED